MQQAIHPEDDRTSPKSRKKVIKMIFLAVLVGLLFNAAFTLFIDRDRVFETFSRVHWLDFIVPFACLFGIYIVDALRYKICFSQYKTRIGFLDGVYNNMIGYFFNNITPMAAGGQPFQIYHLTKIGADAKAATNIVVSRYLEFVFTSLILLMLSITRVFAIGRSTGIGAFVVYVGMGTTLGMTLIVLFMLIRPQTLGHFAIWIEKRWLGKLVGRLMKNPQWAEKVYNWSMGLRETVRFLWKEKLHVMLVDIALNAVSMSLMIFSLYYVVASLSHGFGFISFYDMALIYLLVNFVVYYMPTPGAAGSVEGMYMLVLGGFFGNAGLALSSTIVWRVATYYLHVFLGAAVYLCFDPKKRQVELPGKGNRSVIAS
jgi:hypothetical protein